MAVLGLRFCVRAFYSCGKWGPLFIAVRGPLIIAASLVAEHRPQTRRLSSCGSRAQLLRGMWDPPRPGLEPVSPAPAGKLSTTAPPGKPPFTFNVLTDRKGLVILLIVFYLVTFCPLFLSCCLPLWLIYFFVVTCFDLFLIFFSVFSIGIFFMLNVQFT